MEAWLEHAASAQLSRRRGQPRQVQPGVPLEPDDVARAVLAAAREGRSVLRGPHRTVSLQTRVLAGASRTAPAAAVRALVGRLAR